MNFSDILKTLSNYGITSLYHFTDIENLPTIERFGIQSLKNILLNDIPVKHFGADELSHRLDSKTGLNNYVHLSFIKDHPMYYVAKSRGSLKTPVWIELDISILFQEKTIFCDSIANKNNADIFIIEEIFNKINFSTIVNNNVDFSIRKEARKAEIMIYNEIETNKILGITYGK